MDGGVQDAQRTLQVVTSDRDLGRQLRELGVARIAAQAVFEYLKRGVPFASIDQHRRQRLTGCGM